jgi:DNA-binding MarR family transcriptional regulator
MNSGYQLDPGPPPDFNIDASLTHLLHRAGQHAAELFERNIPVPDMTARQLAVLQTVALHDGISQTEIVTHTGIDRSTITDIVRRLLNKGLLVRHRSAQDARAYCVSLSAAGRAALEAAAPAARRIDTELLGALPPQMRAELIEALSTIVKSFSGGNGTV